MAITNIAGDTKKRSKGKQKIEIKKIQDTNKRQVTFSKRRTGLFKKAAETCLLTGAQIGILVSSPSGRRVYEFCHPDNNALVDRCLNNNNKDATITNNTTGTAHNYHPPLPMKEFNQHYLEVSRELKAEKKPKEMTPVSSDGLRWFDQSVDGLDVEELKRYVCSMEVLKNNILTRADELMMINKGNYLAHEFGYRYGN